MLLRRPNSSGVHRIVSRHQRYTALAWLAAPFRTAACGLLLATLFSCGGNNAPPTESALTVAPAAAVPVPVLAVGVSDLEFIGPFSNWKNARTDYGAIGDGVADDTAAIQTGLNALRKYSEQAGPVVLYFPPGVYRITSTLNMRLNAGANLIGADPATTTITWAGPAGSPMLLTSGSFDTLFTRLTWDGMDSAGIGIAQWWNYTIDVLNYQGSIKHIDEVFRNMGIGIFGGRQGTAYGQGDSETLIERVKFQSITTAAVNVGSANAVNWWIWDSEFTDCARGLSNLFSYNDNGATIGAGILLVYRSVFRRSTVADFSIANTGWFSLHNNVSIGSQQFINAAPAGANGGALIVQGNTVLDTIDPISISMGNEGPLLLIDNSIRSLAGATGAVVRLDGSGATPVQSDRDVYSLGNRYTVMQPIALDGAGGHLVSSQDTIVGRAAITGTIPVLPGVAPNFQRMVYEVAVGASADQIQAVINAAVAGSTDNAVVHIPAGTYHVTHTIVVPANAHLQIAGDSEATQIVWTGNPATGTIIELAGPSYATVRDLCLIGNESTAIAITNADQQGGRIFIEGTQMAALRISGLAMTRVDAQSNAGIAALQTSAVASFVGVGGIGPTQLSANSKVFVADNWYEGDRADILRGDSGHYTYLGGLMAPYSHGVAAGLDAKAPTIQLQDFAGKVNVIGATMVLPVAPNGISVSGITPTASLFFAVSATVPGFFSNTSTSSQVGLVMAKVYKPATGTIDLPDTGNDDPAFVESGFAQARSVIWESVGFVHTPGTTDVRIFRVFTANTATGLQVDH